MFGNRCKILGKIEYKIRYGIFPSRNIFNLLAPGIKNKRTPYGDSEKERLRDEQRAESYIVRRDKMDGFYAKLEESVLRDGVRNPIATVAGKLRTERGFDKLPPYMQLDPTKLWVCDFQGGSRLFMAQRHKLDVPVMIADFVNAFDQYEELTTDEQILSKFQDRPEQIRLYEWGMYFHKIPNVHMLNK